MPLIKPYIVRIANEFRFKSGRDKKVASFDISRAISLKLPVDIISLSELTLRKVRQWLIDRNVNINIDFNDRPLHGFILTFRGSGFIFVNGTDTEEERRYTVAHEASHFILDYKLPRDRAIEKLGALILEVLDGYREATTHEMVDGLLSSTSIQPYTHLLEKSGDGSFNSIKIYNSENDADALALELLAPSADIIKDVKSNKPRLAFEEFKTVSYKILIDKYLLPEEIAKEYAIRLAYVSTGGPSLIAKLRL
jgi:Zn-dependent peptidase ImmA (M78 family)